MKGVVDEIDTSIGVLQEAKQTIEKHNAGLPDDARVANIPPRAVNVVRNLRKLHER